MIKKDKYKIYFVFMTIYIIFAFYNFQNESKWLLDNILAMFLLTVMLFVNNWLKVGRMEFLLFNIAFLLHNLGTFGFYNYTWSIFAYDNLVHFIGSFVVACIAFNFIERKLHIKETERIKKTLLDEHKVIFIFLIMASVAMLGVFVEIIEFFGFLYLGSGEGLFFIGQGDSGNINDLAGQYTDTMTDILVNTLGSVFGVLFFYMFKCSERRWWKY